MLHTQSHLIQLEQPVKYNKIDRERKNWKLHSTDQQKKKKRKSKGNEVPSQHVSKPATPGNRLSPITANLSSSAPFYVGPYNPSLLQNTK